MIAHVSEGAGIRVRVGSPIVAPPSDFAYQASLAHVECSPSVNSYSVGDYLIYEGKLCSVIASISYGDSLVFGTNIAETTVAAELVDLDDAKAPLASPALTGTPTAPTASPGTSTTQGGTTAFVGSAVSTLFGKEIIKVSFGTLTGTGSSVTASQSNAKITADHELIAFRLGTPSAQAGALVVTTSAGEVSVSGAINGSTTLTIYLGLPGTSVT